MSNNVTLGFWFLEGSYLYLNEAKERHVFKAITLGTDEQIDHQSLFQTIRKNWRTCCSPIP